MQKRYDINSLIDTAAGRQEPDLVFKNANIINVFTHEITHGDVAIVGDTIAGIGKYHAPNEIDCTNLFLSPGLIDAHCHIESSMVIPSEFSRAVLPSGTTAVIADPHEIVNVCGGKGLSFMLESSKDSVCDILYMVPSCVPATEFETSGSDFTAHDMEMFLQSPQILGLAEVMCFPDVVQNNPSIMEKIHLFRNRIKDGHAPGLSGNALQAYIASGISTDHEAATFEEAAEKVRSGLSVLIREGSAARNLTSILSGVIESGLSTRHFMFCTDDKHLDDIRLNGHIIQNVRMAIQLGMNPAEAISMASLNTATHYGLNRRGAIAAGYQADLVLFSDLSTLAVEAVYKNGVDSNTLLKRPQKIISFSAEIMESVHLKSISVNDLQLQVNGITDVIQMLPRQIITEHLRETVPVENGLFRPSSEYTKLCVLERHGKNGNIAIAPLKGYGIQGGAVATSVAHDSHNVIAAGDNDDDIALAINHIKSIQGGYVVVSNGKVIGSLPLCVAGLMSTSSYTMVENKTESILKIAKSLGINDDIDPFISLSFMALPVIPTLRLTDQGLIDLFSPDKEH